MNVMRVVFDVRNNLALLRKTDSYAQKQTANRQVSLIIEMTVINLLTKVTMYFFYANIMNIILVSNYLAYEKSKVTKKGDQR